MTVLGLNHDACVDALEQYLARFRELELAIEREREGAVAAAHGGNADVLLDRLLFQLEVDARARESGPGRERMSTIEHDVFAPVVSDLSARFARLATLRPPRQWLPVLMAAQASVLAVLERLH